MRKWSLESIGLEIRRMYESGEDLNYAAIAHEQVALLRAATRYFGSWRGAVEFAGLNYDDIRRYKTWSRDRILERIRELYDNGEDLSWRHVSTKVDPQLAAAATKRKHFGSWREAVSAAGLNYGQIRRYREWDENTIKERLHDLHEQGIDLNAKHMEEYDITLITAARRRYDSWDKALTAAGLDYKQIVLRAPFKRRRTTPSQSEVSRIQHRDHHTSDNEGNSDKEGHSKEEHSKEEHSKEEHSKEGHSKEGHSKEGHSNVERRSNKEGPGEENHCTHSLLREVHSNTDLVGVR